jgi:hypothetical protein
MDPWFLQVSLFNTAVIIVKFILLQACKHACALKRMHSPLPPHTQGELNEKWQDSE